LESLINLKADLVLSCGQPIDVAGRITLSDARNFFASKPFENWKKTRDHGFKLTMAMIGRLDVVIDGLNNVAKSIQNIR
jgi:hypothetical protein